MRWYQHATFLYHLGIRSWQHFIYSHRLLVTTFWHDIISYHLPMLSYQHPLFPCHLHITKELSWHCNYHDSEVISVIYLFFSVIYNGGIVSKSARMMGYSNFTTWPCPGRFHCLQIPHNYCRSRWQKSDRLSSAQRHQLQINDGTVKQSLETGF